MMTEEYAKIDGKTYKAGRMCDGCGGNWLLRRYRGWWLCVNSKEHCWRNRRNIWRYARAKARDGGQARNGDRPTIRRSDMGVRVAASPKRRSQDRQG
jgi:hypothetical protein